MFPELAGAFEPKFPQNGNGRQFRQEFEQVFSLCPSCQLCDGVFSSGPCALQNCITPSSSEANRGTVRCVAASAVTVINLVVKEQFGGVVQQRRDLDLRLMVVPEIISKMAELGFGKE